MDKILTFEEITEILKTDDFDKLVSQRESEIFEAVLKARHKFEKDGENVVACKVQDNLAGETILAKKVVV